MSAIWSRGRHFRVQDIDINRTTYDSGISATFDQETFAGSGQFQKYTYYGHISEILAIGYQSFELYILDVKWYQAVIGGSRPSIKVAQNGFVVVDSRRLWSNCTDTFVLPDQCDQVCYHPVHGDLNWLYVVDVAPRATQVFDNENTLTPMNERDISISKHEGQDYEEDMVASEEHYNDLSSTDSESSPSSGFSHSNSIQEGIGINVAKIEEETTSQSTIGLTLEFCLELDAEDM